jgi:predicted nucleic acid-binding protein
LSKNRLLDTNRLSLHWKRMRVRPLVEYSRDDAKLWADKLIELEGSKAICSPIVVEFLCGVMNSHELEMSRTFLERFDVVDGGNITREDWETAKRYAAWVRNNSGPRDFGDCLIAAIAKRLKYDLGMTNDKELKRRTSSPEFRGKS